MPEAPECHALLIGVNQYETPDLRPLDFAVADVLEFREFLRGRVGVPDSQCRLMTSPATLSTVAPRKASILDAIEEMADSAITKKDTFVLYIAVHGFTIDGETFLLAMDSRVRSKQVLRETAISVSVLLEFADRIRAGQQVLILDAWRHDPIRSEARGPGAGFEANMSGTLISSLESRPRGAGTFGGRVILTSCRGGQCSHEYPRGGHGWFANNLTGFLRENFTDGIEIGKRFASWVNDRMEGAASRELPGAAGQQAHAIVQGRPIRLRTGALRTATAPIIAGSAQHLLPGAAQVPAASMPALEAASSRGGGGLYSLPPVPSEIEDLLRQASEIGQALRRLVLEGEGENATRAEPMAGLAEAAEMEQGLAAVKARLQAKQEEDFEGVLRSFFGKMGDIAEFPLIAWMDLAPLLRERRYGWSPVELAGRAEACFESWKDDADWVGARKSMSLPAVRRYLAEWPAGRHEKEANNLMQPLLDRLWKTRLQEGQPWENSLDMRFMPVPGSKVFFSVWPVRVKDYRAFVEPAGLAWDAPHFNQGPTHPAVNVSYSDAQAFCAWLTARERDTGYLGLRQQYRLPTDQEWSLAVGLENEVGATPAEKALKSAGSYPWGTQWPPPPGAGNYAPALRVDSYEFTSPVGSFEPNRHGLYDMGGNVWEWCVDWQDAQQTLRVLRGGSWVDSTAGCLTSAYRSGGSPDGHNFNFGFRIVLASL